MKGDPQIIEALNRGLTVELTAINQYFIQAKMNKNWGFNKLAKKHYVESIGAAVARLRLDGGAEPGAVPVPRAGRGVPVQQDRRRRREYRLASAHPRPAAACRGWSQNSGSLP